jgi:hypothetical protein
VLVLSRVSQARRSPPHEERPVRGNPGLWAPGERVQAGILRQKMQIPPLRCGMTGAWGCVGSCMSPMAGDRRQAAETRPKLACASRDAPAEFPHRVDCHAICCQPPSRRGAQGERELDSQNRELQTTARLNSVCHFAGSDSDSGPTRYTSQISGVTCNFMASISVVNSPHPVPNPS